MWAEAVRGEAVRATFAFLLVLASFSVAALDEPDFTVIEQLGESMEVREYPAFTTASVAIDADIKSAGNQGFRLLADYIFGNNQADEKIAMTAPVFQTRIAEDAQKVSFYLTHSADEAPLPVNERVEIESSAMTVAVIRYKGGWGMDKYEQHLNALVDELEATGAWRITGEPIWARYDPPFKPPWWRTNEVMLPVDRINGR
ncbi:MAG: heme-binding protein [Pseudomonadales bacterium]|nr:heme-binding protein [Pseudomonadales bacterium]